LPGGFHDSSVCDVDCSSLNTPRSVLTDCVFRKLWLLPVSQVIPRLFVLSFVPFMRLGSSSLSYMGCSIARLSMIRRVFPRRWTGPYLIVHLRRREVPDWKVSPFSHPEGLRSFSCFHSLVVFFPGRAFEVMFFSPSWGRFPAFFIPNSSDGVHLSRPGDPPPPPDCAPPPPPPPVVVPLVQTPTPAPPPPPAASNSFFSSADFSLSVTDLPTCGRCGP